jgi:phage terminase large subunit GpA-like protein
VQDDRLAFEFVAWGPGEESWSLDYLEIFGDPGRAKLWEDADDQLARIFRRDDGAALTVAACGIDTAGHYTKQAYAWCKKHKGRGVFALVGRGGKGRPIVVSGRKPIKVHRIKLHTVGVDTLKELLLMSRIRIKAAGPGYCHFPARYAMSAPTFFTGITAEKRVVAYSKGQPVHRWEVIQGRRNEPLDCRNYATAALALLNPNFDALAERVESTRPEPEEEPTPPPTPEEPKREAASGIRRSTPGGWMTRRR